MSNFEVEVYRAAIQEETIAYNRWVTISMEGVNQPTNTKLSASNSTIEKWSEDWQIRHEQAKRDYFLAREVSSLAREELDEFMNDLSNLT